MKQFIIGVDVGTTGTKASVVDLTGKNLGSSYRDYPFIHPEPGWVQLSASNVREQVFVVISEAVKASGVNPDEIASIALSVQRATFTLVDSQYEALEDTFFVWLDQRSTTVMDEIAERMDPDYRAEISGIPSVPIFAPTKLFWLKKHRPDLYAQARYFATVDGYLMKQLGGTEFCDELSSAQTAGMIDVRTMDWNHEIMAALDLDPDMLPRLVKPGDVVGTINKELQVRAGLPADVMIVAGAGDQQAGALGAGVVAEGDVSIVMGTGGFVIVNVSDPDFVRFNGLMVATTPNIGVFEVEGNQNSGATCYRWFKEIGFSAESQIAQDLGMDPYNFLEQYVVRSAPGANGVLFLAGLFGTGYPTWNAEASGAFLGLRATHTRGDMLRAVMEGVTLEARRMLEAVRDTGATIKPVITVSGGATRSATWRQVLADTMNATCRTLEMEDSAVLGVACIAAVGAGLVPDFHQAASQMVKYKHTVEPNPANVGVHDRAYSAYFAAHNALAEGGIYDLINNINPKETA